ncbi:MAG: kelch repeat-containing protein [Candidatus Thermoplasmatota archaeon]|nr:kelch repeat-containing protein [Candidatus Thermoplasmatota archaeon]
MKGMTAIFFSIWVIFLFLGIPIAAGSASTEDRYGSIQSVQAMHQGRFNHTATTLKDGRVLVTGGTPDGYASLRSAEIFDPKTKDWDRLPDMLDPRMRHTSNILLSGDVLIAGGYYGGGHPSIFHSYKGPGNHSIDGCEIFDPSTLDFRRAAPMMTGRFWHRAVELKDGRIMVIGGLNVTHSGLGSCEIFDPTKGTWTEAASLNEPRARFTATVLANGSVIVTGGHNGTVKVPTSTCEIYIPTEDRWYRIAPMNDARGYHSALLLGDGRLMVSGGFSGPKTPDHHSSEIYDPVLGIWTLSGPMRLGKHAHSMILLSNGGIISHGGSSVTDLSCQVCGLEYYDTVSGIWSDTYLLMLGRAWPAEADLPDGGHLICGGLSCNEAKDVTDIYYPPGHFVAAKGDDDRIDPTYMIIGALVLVALVLVALRFALPRILRPAS